MLCYVSAIAPGTYKPENSKLDHTPAYSFGVKAKSAKVSATPGWYTLRFFSHFT